MAATRSQAAWMAFAEGIRPPAAYSRSYSAEVFSDFLLSLTDLKYAHRDAKAFRDFLQSNLSGGQWELTTLVDDEATLHQVDKSLTKTLTQANKRDLVIIFTSGRGTQPSWEDDDLGHGVFTYYLLKGLSGNMLFSMSPC
jgi:hypothetical protein